MKRLLFLLVLATVACQTHNVAQPMSKADADARQGRRVFSANCAACHGAAGEGAQIGPSLRNLRARKSAAQTEQWIRDPEPPMPKLYPAELSAKDVNDVTAYVQTL